MENNRPVDSNISDTNPMYNVPSVKHYIDEHFAEDISLDSISKLFEINKYQLAKTFKLDYDLSVGNYIRYQRISKAKSLLRFTSDKIENIGTKCGIGDANYFSRLFKQYEGISPGEYRKKWKA
jgi:two-component system response regulator YesN